MVLKSEVSHILSSEPQGQFPINSLAEAPMANTRYYTTLCLYAVILYRKKRVWIYIYDCYTSGAFIFKLKWGYIFNSQTVVSTGNRGPSHFVFLMAFWTVLVHIVICLFLCTASEAERRAGCSRSGTDQNEAGQSLFTVPLAWLGHWQNLPSGHHWYLETWGGEIEIKQLNVM